MMPVRYYWKSPEVHQLAPDVFVAFVPDHPRGSFDVSIEGGFPPFVLEVLSPSSTKRDREEKREAYENLGVQVYALFTPRATQPSSLQDYRLKAAGTYRPWRCNRAGRLWSEVLGLYLIRRRNLLYAQTHDGRPLLGPEEAETPHRQAEEGRRRTEAEVERLRQEIERLRGSNE